MAKRENGSGASQSGETVQSALDGARSVGGWMPWVGTATAVAWWGAATGTAIAAIGPAGLADLQPMLLFGGVLGAFVPGLLMITAGYMARESRRSAATNAIVMEAAVRLLEPARETSREASVFADAMSRSVQDVDRAMNGALEGLQKMGADLGDERLRLESVAYTCADNSRDLAERLGDERRSLEALARELRVQTEEMSQAIPRQAEAMVEAASKASAEVAAADDALDARLKSLEASTISATAKITELDQFAEDAIKRSQDLSFAIARLEEKLDQSTKTVDTAVKASEMAVSAAGTAGDKLKDAVSAALDTARIANKEITESTRKASSEAADALVNLHHSSVQSAAAVKAAGDAARTENDLVERQLERMAAAFSRLSREARANGEAPSEEPATPSAATAETAPAPSVVKPDSISDDDLFEPSDDDIFEDDDVAIGVNGTNDHGPEAAPALRPRAEPLAPVTISGPQSEIAFPREALRKAPNGLWGSDSGLAPKSEAREAPVNGVSGSSAAWREILADIDKSDTEAQSGPARETTAETLISRLQASGIKLPDAFRGRDKKKIAEAAKKGELERRITTRNVAKREVERVSIRLEKDTQLRELAQDFVSMEAADALRALEQTQRSGRAASPRLSAYLLIDAALG